MDYYAIWPFFGCMAVLYGAAATPLFRWADQPPTKVASRVPQLDGLREFLALGVVFHHATMYHQFHVLGIWSLVPSGFYTVLGQGGVSMFFMITAFLFWGKVTREQGRGGSLDWPALYIGRVFRIGPLYLVAVLAMFAIVAVQTRFMLGEPLPALLRHVGVWLLLGAGPQVDVNGYADAGLLLVFVMWSLQFEWAFYALLIVGAVIVRPWRWAPARLRPWLPALLPFALMCVFLPRGTPGWPSRSLLLSLFCIGMLCACVRRAPRLPPWVQSVLVVAALTASLTLFPYGYQPEQAVLLGCVFYLITQGCDVFGILVSRPARRLGDVSYGIYVLQGLFLALVFRPAPLRAFALASPWQFWGLSLAAALMLSVAATATHVWVERPGVQAGARLVAMRLRRRQPAGAG